MTVYSQLFETGQDFDAFVATGQASEISGATHARGALATHGIDEQVRQRLAAIQGNYYLLAAGEMWCPDCRLNLAALDYLCAVQPRVRLAVIPRARAEQALRERLGLERVSIPLVLVLDAEFKLLGLFIERPQAVIDGGPPVLAAYKAGEFLAATLSDVLAILETAETAR